MKKQTILLVAILMVPFVNAGINDGLAAFYHLDGNATDSSANNNNGTVYGATVTNGYDGTPDSAYYFDGGNDYIFIPSSSSLDITGSVSLCVWVKNDGDDRGQIMWRGDTQNAKDPYMLHIHENNMDFRQDRGDGVHGGTGQYIVSSEAVDNNWHFWVGVLDVEASKSYLYRDGTLQDSIDVIEPIQYSTANMWNVIGAVDNGDWQFFRGTIDEVRIYNRALTYTEVIEIQNIPEPCTLLLFGLGGLLIRKRK